MPVFSELGAAAQVGDRVNATVLHPEIHAAAESRRQRDVETSVSGQQRGVLAILLDSLFTDDKHRNFRSVLRVVPNLLDVVGGRIDGGRVHFGPKRALHAGQIDAVNRRWHGEGLESEKDFVAVIAAGGIENASDRGKRNVGEFPAVEPKQLQFGSRIVFVLQ